MVKTVLSTSHMGLRDWAIQRVTAIIMVVYSLALILYCIASSPMNYIDWHHLFSYSFVKIATVLFLMSVMYHAWIGIWTVVTDYVKWFVLRCVIHTIVIIALIYYFLDGLRILWGT